MTIYLQLATCNPDLEWDKPIVHPCQQKISKIRIFETDPADLPISLKGTQDEILAIA